MHGLIPQIEICNPMLRDAARVQLLAVPFYYITVCTTARGTVHSSSLTARTDMPEPVRPTAASLQYRDVSTDSSTLGQEYSPATPPRRGESAPVPLGIICMHVCHRFQQRYCPALSSSIGQWRHHGGGGGSGTTCPHNLQMDTL